MFDLGQKQPLSEVVQYEQPWLNILGTRGIPASHGGFETFAEKLALHLTGRGWKVCVYCQIDPDPTLPGVFEETWNGITLVKIQAKDTALGSILHDFKSVKHVLGRPGIDLVLGYNTAIFNVAERLHGRHVVMNMDGLEWKRKKWKSYERAWLFFNELVGSNASSAAIADHPEIEKSVKSRSFKSLRMIPYGADRIQHADVSHIKKMGLEPGKYFVSIARPEPENSILELVKAFEAADLNDHKLVVLGKFSAENEFHRDVMDAAGENVVFPGGIYDADHVAALRFYCRTYLHGHQVGGTNPSLVEALGAGNPVLAHDNHFNRWTAGGEQLFFSSVEQCAEHMRSLAAGDSLCETLQMAALRRYERDFRWEDVLGQYEDLLLEGIPATSEGADETSAKPGAVPEPARWNSTYARLTKRFLDVALVVLTAPIALCLVGLFALLIRRDGGPAFYTHERLGQNGKTFACYKLRSMRQDADHALFEYLAKNRAAKLEWDTFQKLERDPRVTKLGQFLRRTKADEIPQLLNVLKGEMSLVGPRPMMPDQLPDYTGNSYDKLKPGLTGLWQISGGPALPFDQRGVMDDKYAATLSLWRDVRIMGETVLLCLRADSR